MPLAISSLPFFAAEEPEVDRVLDVVEMPRPVEIRARENRLDYPSDTFFAELVAELIDVSVAPQNQLFLGALNAAGRDRPRAVAPLWIPEARLGGESVDQPRLSAREAPNEFVDPVLENLTRLGGVLAKQRSDLGPPELSYCLGRGRELSHVPISAEHHGDPHSSERPQLANEACSRLAAQEIRLVPQDAKRPIGAIGPLFHDLPQCLFRSGRGDRLDRCSSHSVIISQNRAALANWLRIVRIPSWASGFRSAVWTSQYTAR